MGAEAIGQERNVFRRRKSTKEAGTKESKDGLLCVRNTTISYSIRCAQGRIGACGSKKEREQGKRLV